MRNSSFLGISLLMLSFLVTTISTQSSTLSDDTIPFTISCRMTYAGHHYAGPQNTTKSGHPCQSWAAIDPHYNYYVNSSHFPEVSSSNTGARCRNPDSNWHGGLWCYTTDPNVRWENCDVQYCECKVSESGREYEGHVSNTTGGHRCQAWAEQSPNPHPYTSLRFFPDFSMSTAGNNCRNPNNSRPLGPWCYVDSDDTQSLQWEYCSVPQCDWNHIEVYRRPLPTEATSPEPSTPPLPVTRTTRTTGATSTTFTMATRPRVTRATTPRKPTSSSTLATTTNGKFVQDPPGLNQYNTKMSVIKVVVPVVMVTSVAMVLAIVGILICLKKRAVLNAADESAPTENFEKGFDNPTWNSKETNMED